jgi:hypothetical protein
MAGHLSHMGQMRNAQIFYLKNLKEEMALDALLHVGESYYSEL